MTPFRFATLTFLAIASLAVGCDRGAPTPKAADHDHEGHHAHHDAAKPAAAVDAGPAGPRIETDAFALEVASVDPPLRVGKDGSVAIALEGRGDWHVNQEFPIRVNIAADPAIGLKAQELVKDDAKEFTEDKVRFVALVEPSKSGEHEVSCDVSFAMCTDDNCVLEKRTVAMQVKVQ